MILNKSRKILKIVIFFYVFCIFSLEVSPIFANTDYYNDPDRLSAEKRGIQEELVQQLKVAIDSRDWRKFQKFADRSKYFSLPEDRYLELLRHASKPEAPPCFLNYLIQKTSERFPKTKVGSYVFPTGAIKEAGLKLILDGYKKENKNLSFSIRNSYENLQEEVSKKLANPDNPPNGHGIFFHEGASAHWSLVFLKKDFSSHQCVLQILDAAQHVQAATIYSRLKNGLPKNCIFKVEKFARQADSTSCSVFAVTDFLELSQNPASSDHHVSCPKTLIQEPVSPSLMSLTQSSRTIADYVDSTQQIFAPEAIEAMKQEVNQSTKLIPRYRGEPFPPGNSLCSSDRKVFFNPEKDTSINIGAKTLHDQYVVKILEQVLSPP